MNKAGALINFYVPRVVEMNDNKKKINDIDIDDDVNHEDREDINHRTQDEQYDQVSGINEPDEENADNLYTNTHKLSKNSLGRSPFSKKNDENEYV